MKQASVGLHFLLLLLIFHPVTSADLQEVDKVPVEVITDSSPCSTTCGLGVKTQTLCFLKDGKMAMEVNVRRGDGTKVTDECRVRKVQCLESWQCGLRTMTVTSGQRVEIDCLEEVMDAMGRFSWRVSWRHARGIISSDDTLFARWEAPQLVRVILDPVREEDAGTYRCEVQDATFHRVKRVYWGIRVLPVDVLNLDYESSLAVWDLTGKQQNQTVPTDRTFLPYVMVASLTFAGACVGLLGLYGRVRRRRRRRRGALTSEAVFPHYSFTSAPRENQRAHE